MAFSFKTPCLKMFRHIYNILLLLLLYCKRGDLAPLPFVSFDVLNRSLMTA